MIDEFHLSIWSSSSKTTAHPKAQTEVDSPSMPSRLSCSFGYARGRNTTSHQPNCAKSCRTIPQTPSNVNSDRALRTSCPLVHRRLLSRVFSFYVMALPVRASPTEIAEVRSAVAPEWPADSLAAWRRWGRRDHEIDHLDRLHFRVRCSLVIAHREAHLERPRGTVAVNDASSHGGFPVAEVP